MSSYESVPYPNNTIHSLTHYVGKAGMGVFLVYLCLGSMKLIFRGDVSKLYC